MIAANISHLLCKAVSELDVESLDMLLSGENATPLLSWTWPRVKCVLNAKIQVLKDKLKATIESMAGKWNEDNIESQLVKAYNLKYTDWKFLMCCSMCCKP